MTTLNHLHCIETASFCAGTRTHTLTRHMNTITARRTSQDTHNSSLGITQPLQTLTAGRFQNSSANYFQPEYDNNFVGYLTRSLEGRGRRRRLEKIWARWRIRGGGLWSTLMRELQETQDAPSQKGRRDSHHAIYARDTHCLGRWAHDDASFSKH